MKNGPVPDSPFIIGQSGAIKKIRRKIERLGNNKITVLISGESGTGKELVARSIHYHLRGKAPLVKINCAALPDELLESELFGFRKGAFTGAHKDKPGRLELAHNGTLFIDEIGALSLSSQAKFLQIMEDKEFSRLGDTQDQAIDARIISATNADLRQKVKEGTFRNDLYYRLNIISIVAPPLRDRKEDIPSLVDYFIDKYSQELRKNHLELPLRVIRYFEDYNWPGNVRELENIIRRIIVLEDYNFVFNELSLDRENPDYKLEMASNYPSRHLFWDDDKIKKLFQKNNFSMKDTTRIFISEMERLEMLKGLKATHWNRKKAADLLQISYKTLLNRIQELGLRP